MKEAGLARGDFYHHFRNKGELYAEAVRSFSTCNPFAVRRAADARRFEAHEVLLFVTEVVNECETQNRII